MSDPANPASTEAYKSAPPPERVRVALVGGSGALATDDLYPLLRRRLLILTSIIASSLFFAFLVAIIVRTILPITPQYTGVTLEWLLDTWPEWLLLALHGVAALILWRRPPRSVRGLRLIELLAVGSLVVVMLITSVSTKIYADLEWAAAQSYEMRAAFFGAYVLAGSLFWSLVIIGYGTLIPNTWQRCTAVVGVMAASKLGLFAIHAFWLRPLPAEDAVRVLAFTGLWIGIAVALTLFAASRIEILRQEAAEARKLGQYVLKEKLGTGGMGEVYRAEHVLLRRPCALKLIRPERAGDPKNLRRFEREVQVTATLTHPNTVQIFDYGHTEDGTFYYVMEYLPGKNLEELVAETGPLSPDRVVHLLRQVCGALREAHAAGLIHRDIKPSNVIVCERGGITDVAKLLDFGIVDAPSGGPEGDLTGLGQLVGTPLYMSAEQAAGLPLDARSDLYSLGATAYFLLTGRSPFARATNNLVIVAHLRDDVTPPHLVHSGIPADLSEVIVRCLEKDPAKRYPDAAALDKALAACACASDWTEQVILDGSQTEATHDGKLRANTTEFERR